ncbi:uncharacterized protein LOC136028931 isoform X2 [Artemia franciscana]|uniref:CHK kinase-like domain-containing protein n=2 Tax=Artemia franciscana TaxID=6661 RepID=A0AA88HDF3_ARTSF|nr:hypothetical protein QYM36_014887 [Artemia franciscana]
MDSLSDEFWAKIFSTDKGVTATAKLSAIETKKLVNSYDDYYVEDTCGTKYKIVTKKVSAIGDNYMSDAYTICIIHPQGKKLQCFVKVLPQTTALRNMAKSSQLHDREIKLYREYLPALQDLINQHGIQDKIHLKSPRLFYAHLDETKATTEIYKDPDNDNPWSALINMDDTDDFETIIVLEDLIASGHRMNNKRVGADLPHVRIALDALAQYHATGIAYLRKNGKPVPHMKWLSEITIMEVNPQYMFGKAMPGQIGFLRQCGEPELADRLATFTNNINKVLRYEEPGSMGPLETIVHGDFWNNNMMFLYNNEEVKDISLVDFQIVRHGHPCNDLGYYLLANTTGEFRRNHLRTVLQEFYRNLIGYVRLFGIDLEKEGYSETQFFDDWKARLARGFLFALMVLPAILGDQAEMQEKLAANDKLMSELKPSDDDSDEIKTAKKESLKEQTEALFMDMLEHMVTNENLKTRLLDVYREMAEQSVF